MTLFEFQQSSGIPLKETICLIDNPFFSSYLRENGYCSEYSTLRQLKDIIGLNKSVVKLFFGDFNRSVDNLDDLFKMLQKTRFTDSVEVLIGKGDYEINSETAGRFGSNVISVTGNNLNIQHSEQFSYLPMGRDFRSYDLFEVVKPSVDKEDLVYANFSANTHPIREVILDTLKKLDFVRKEHMGKFLKYPVSRKDFFSRIAKSKFSICPRGNALDTFRLWDSLYLGCIPIVVKEGAFHNELLDLPILFLDSYDQIENMNVAYLEEFYSQALHKDYNYEKLKLSHWLPHS